ncbi:hypothetical protein OSB04_un001717 [Centaurea solstitialis]|uniref:SWIM-type domain-containing protein n=1 Tax=Centaurea solstitialis TaxID=347529 RepID=A0AA38SFN7_9ASTR|nr:hypothetical protein OSB04_un001717 [Centaurea solstitialis]
MWVVRQKDEEFHEDDVYGAYKELFSMKIHHGGVFSGSLGRQYLNGKVTFVDLVDPMSCQSMSYHGTYMMYYHFLIPNSDLDFGLRAFGCDQDVLNLLQYVSQCKIIKFYVEHGSTKLKTYFVSPEPKRLPDEPSTDDVGSSRCRKRLCLEWDYKEDEKNKVVEGLEDVATNEIGNDVDALEDVATNEIGNDVDGLEHFASHDIDKDALDDFDPFFGQTYSAEKEGNEGAEGERSEGAEGERSEGDEGDTEDERSEGDDSDYIGDEEDIDYMAEVDMTSFNENVDWEAEWVGNEGDKEEVEYEAENPMDFDDNESDSSGSLESSRKKELRKLKKMHEKKEDIVGAAFNFYVGQIFGTKEEIKKMITMYSLHACRDIRLIKNDKTRLRAICKGQNPVFKEVGGSNKEVGGSKKKAKKASASGEHCPWVLHVSTCNNESTWTVKTYVGGHTCLQSRKLKLCTANVLSEQIMEDITPNPDIPLKTLHEQIQKRFQISVSSQQVFRAKKMASKRLRGDYEQQYLLLRDYLVELQRSNPGTTVKLEMEIEPNPHTTTRQFKRVYICLGDLKQGFKALGRDLLGLDGCFMKGMYPGQVLTAVGVDPNHGTYPLAYAIVEAETTNSWSWFLELLGDDLDLEANSNFTFISDRQKGIIPAIAKVFPSAEHRFCYRHILENMKLKWKGKAYNDLLWRCAAATTVPQFHAEMEQVRKFNVDAYNWLKQIPPHHWSRSHFTGRAKCDVLLNNMCEVFNKQLVDGRDKPIITALEYIREYLMRRLVLVQKVIDKSQGPLTPTIAKMLGKIKEEASQLVVTWNGSTEYQVNGAWGDQCCVNLEAKFCACRRWELTGIPCKHAVAAIWFSAANGGTVALPENWVHPHYHLQTWKMMYQFKINPTNGRLLWPKSDYPIKIMPPKHHKQIGRPKKSRRKTAEELSQPLVKGSKLLKIGKAMTCRICHKQGHNARTCKGKGTPS